jgi:branched-chain amino acid transport system substrate-binding protein
MNAATSSITRGSPYYVRTSVTVPQWSATIGKWAPIVTDYAPGYDAETYFHKMFTPIQETNFAPYMERALQARPDALYMFQPGGSRQSPYRDCGKRGDAYHRWAPVFRIAY